MGQSYLYINLVFVISCKAVKKEDGTYRLKGSKMWISGGDHSFSNNIVSMPMTPSLAV